MKAEVQYPPQPQPIVEAARDRHSGLIYFAPSPYAGSDGANGRALFFIREDGTVSRASGRLSNEVVFEPLPPGTKIILTVG